MVPTYEVAARDRAVRHAIDALGIAARRGGTRDRRAGLSPPRTTKSSAHWNSSSRELAVGPGPAHLRRTALVGAEAAAERRPSPGAAPARRTACRARSALLDPAPRDGRARRRGFDELERVGRHERDAAGAPGRVAAAAGALQQPRDALRPSRSAARARPAGSRRPRSSDEVATTAFSRPSLRPSSTQSRTSLSSEPWCSAITPAQSGRASSINWYQVSACERMLVKTRVVAALSISRTTGSSICMPRWPPQGKRPGSPAAACR